MREVVNTQLDTQLFDYELEIEGFSKSLRKEVNPLGIKVTLIEPGSVGTDMQSESSEEQQQKEEK